MSRTYIFGSTGTSRARAVLAALAAGALLAGCGGGGRSTTPAAGASSAATPVVSSSGVQIQATGGSSGGSTAVAGSVAGGQSAGQISGGQAGSFSKTSASGAISSAPNASYSHTSDAVVSAAQLEQQQKAAAKALEDAATTNSTTKTATTTTTTPSTSTSTAQSPPKKAQSPPKQVTTTQPKTVVRYVTRYKTHTVYRTHTQTVTKTLVKQVNVSPDVPVGAYLPSKHPQLAQSSFTITGTNIGCAIAGATVRCGIQQRAWAAPPQPSSCKGSWGDTIQLGGNSVPKFACGGSDPISSGAKVIPAGWDDKVGKVTCEVRSFGVNCFSTSRSGFMISRTGYSLY